MPIFIICIYDISLCIFMYEYISISQGTYEYINMYDIYIYIYIYICVCY